MKVLFVCEGNTMRSPMAEVFYNSLTHSNDAMSAGAAPVPIGGAPFPEVIAAMSEKDLSVSDCRSKLVTPKMIDNADVVIAFPTPCMPKYVLASPKTRLWGVTDPYYAPTDGTDYIRLARDTIEKRVLELIKE